MPGALLGFVCLLLIGTVTGHVGKQVDGLVLFGTQPSSYVKVRIIIRAWLERLYPCQDTALL